MTVDYPRAVWVPSPNYWPGRQGYTPTHIVMHGTAGTMPGCLDWLTQTASVASVHYLVACDGVVYQLVREQDTAWGNGIVEPGSMFPDIPNPNRVTISVEHERNGDNTSPITAAQQGASAMLIASIRSRYGHLPLIPHSAIAPQSRAHCPGPNFPMQAIDGDGTITWVHFTARPQVVPLTFYADASRHQALYTSAATKATLLDFDGWQYGESIIDPVVHAPDRRWYHRHNPMGNQGWTPSAFVDNNPPGSVP